LVTQLRIVLSIDLAGNGLSEGFILLGQLIDSTKFNGYFVLIRIDGTGSVFMVKKIFASISFCGWCFN